MIFTAFVFGLMSSLHCIGMCGPIAMMLPVNKNNQAKKALQILVYHLGRTTAYASIGLLFGLLGKGFFLAGIQQQISIIAGICILTVAVIPTKIFSKYNFSKPIYKVLSKIKSSLGHQFQKRTFTSLFIIGLLNGFLPCGMVYVALFGAIAMQSALYGSAYMLLFGIGTMPLMSSVLYFDSFLSVSFRNSIQKAVPMVTFLIGVVFILRGLGLGIPYISPTTLNLFVQARPSCH